jgi:hypothetical protein
MNKKVLTIIVMFLCFAGVASASSINGDYKGNPIVNVKVNFKTVNPDVPAMIIDGVTMVPLRAVTESMGGNAFWDEKTYTVNIVTANPKSETTTSTPVETPAPSVSAKVKGPLKLYSFDGKTFLGVLTSDKYGSDSVYNAYGTYGNKYASNSIWNEYGNYGSEYSTTSAFNDYTSTPPIILDGNGEICGYLTTNTTIKGGISPIGLYEFLNSEGY